MPLPTFVLASASPRRSELLRASGFTFEVIPGNADERVLPGEVARAYAVRVAVAKAEAVKSRAHSRPVLAADTIVVVGAEILGKPADAGDAARMLRLLSGDRKSTRLNSSHTDISRMPSSA